MKRKNDALDKFTTVNFYTVNTFTVIFFIVASVFFFSNIPYYQPAKEPLYKYRMTEYNPNTSNYKEYLIAGNKLTEKTNEIFNKYNIGSKYEGIGAEVRKRAVNELEHELLLYLDFLRSNKVVKPLEKLEGEDEQEGMASNGFSGYSFYRFMMYDIEESLKDGKLDNEEIKRYINLLECIKLEMDCKNPRLIDSIITQASLGIILNPFIKEDNKDEANITSIKKEYAMRMNEQIHYIKENLAYHMRDGYSSQVYQSGSYLPEIFPLYYNNRSWSNDKMLASEFEILNGIEEFDDAYVKEAIEAGERVRKNYERQSNKNAIAKLIINSTGDPIELVSTSMYSGMPLRMREKMTGITAVDYLMNKELYKEAPRDLVSGEKMKYIEDGKYEKVYYKDGKKQTKLVCVKK